MKTIYDLVTLSIFAGLVILFLQRSTEETPRDKMIQYAPPAIGCAVANFFGNHGLTDHNNTLEIVAWVLIASVLAYVVAVLKPFPRKG